MYPTVQPRLSGLSAHLPFAVLDLVVVGCVGAVAFTAAWARRCRRPWMGAALLLLGGGVAWLGFQALWGWHYQHPTLEQRLVGDPAAGAATLAARAPAVAAYAVARLNALDGVAHATAWPDAATLEQSLGPALQSAIAEVGVPWTPRLPAPKRSVFDGYFRRTGIDGVTNPFGLEVVLHARLLPVERTTVLAHEWAHLAGLADESDASFVAWMAGVRAGGQLEYAAWLAVLPHLVGALPGDARATVVAALAEGPRADLRAIARRGDDRWPALQSVAWRVYDRFLKANRVTEGIARYDAVTRLLLLAADERTGGLR